MTLRRLDLLIQRRDEADRTADYRAAVLIHVAAQLGGAKKPEQAVRSYFPHLADGESEGTDGEMAAKLENLRAYLMRQNALRERRGD